MIAKILEKLFSGRFISTIAIVFTYCAIMFLTTWKSLNLLIAGKEIGKELIIFVIGNFTGTAMGAVVAYHFKKQEKNGGEK